MTFRARLQRLYGNALSADERRTLVWLGSLGPLLWAVTSGDWVYVEDLPRGMP